MEHGFDFGEWLVPSRPDNTGEQYGICKESAFYIAPFFGYETLCRMKEICQVLGEKEKETRYTEIADQMKHAIQNGLLRVDSAGISDGRLCSAFAFGLVPEDLYSGLQESSDRADSSE